MVSSRPARTLSPRYLFLIAMAALGSGGTLACGSGDGTGPTPPPPPPPPTVTVTVTPPTATLIISETISLTATVTNSTTAPTWTSSATGVATVSGAGLVTAVTAGTATITAAVGSASAGAVITVTAPSVAIGAITQNGQPVNLANVSGVISIDATANVPADFIGTIEARLDGVVIGSTDLTATPAPTPGAGAAPALAPRERRLLGRTAITEIVGNEEIARLPNGQRTLELALLAPNGLQIATQTAPSPVTLNNKNQVVIRGMTFSGNTFMDGQNVTWGRGNMNFRANYIRYDGGPTGTWTELVGSIQPMTGGPIPITVPVSSSLGLHAFFSVKSSVPPPGGIKGVEGELSFSDAFLHLLGESTPTRFPIGNNEILEFFGDPPDPFWYPDNAGPTSSVLPVSDPFHVNAEWQVGDHWSLNLGFRYQADANGPATVTDGGSGFLDGRWDARNALGQMIQDYVQTGGDLPPTNGFTLFLEGVGVDRVGNWTIWPLRTSGGSPAGIGTDFIPPVGSLNLEGSYLGDNELNPASGSWRIDVTDPPNSLGGSSGVAHHFNSSLTRIFPGLSDNDRCPLGTLPDGLFCPPVEHLIPSDLLQLRPEWQLQGKYRAQLQAIDNANNLGPAFEFWFFNDLLPGIISDPFGPTTIPGGIEMPFGASFTDEVDLFSVEGSLKFDDAPFRVGLGPIQIGDPRSTTLTRQYMSNILMMTYRSLEGVQPSSPFAPTGIIRPLTDYYAGARDVGGNLSGTFLPLTGRSTPATTSFGATGQDWFELLLSGVTVCDPSGGHDCGGIPTSLQAKALGLIPDNGNMIGITELRFFAVIPGADGAKVAVPVGEPAVRTINDMGGFFEYHWDATLDAAAFPHCTDGIVAIGHDATGAGLHTSITPIIFHYGSGDLSAWRSCTPY